MKRTGMMILASGLLLSGCVVYEPVHRDQGMHRGEYERDRDHERGREHQRERDSDGDGIPDRVDRRPYDRDRY